MLFLLQHYSYSVSDIKEPQPPPFPPSSFGFDITQREKYSFHLENPSSAYCYHFLSLNMNYFNPPAINSLLDENKKKKSWECNLTFVLLIYLVSSSFCHCFSVCMSYFKYFFYHYMFIPIFFSFSLNLEFPTLKYFMEGFL